MKKLSIVEIHNPLSRDRLIRAADFLPGKTIDGYIRPALAKAGTDLIVYHNREIVPEDALGHVIPKPGDTITITPVVRGEDAGGKILQGILGLALMFVTMGIGSVISGGAFAGAGFIGMGAWGAWAWIAATTANLVGGYLLSTMFTPPAAETAKPRWGGLVPLDGQGTVVGITFGTTRTAGTVLQRRIVQRGDKQEYDYLATGGEGEIDSVSSIKAGVNPITNYTDVQLDIRLGTNNQDVIPGFDDTFETQLLAQELTVAGGWSPAQQTTGDAGTGLEVVLECPYGLYHQTNNGDLETATVRAELEYRAVGAGNWIPWKSSTDIHQDNSAHYTGEYQVTVNGDKTAIFILDLEVSLKDQYWPTKTTTVINSVYNAGTDTTAINVVATVCLYTYAIIWGNTGNYFQLAASTSSPVRRTYRIDGLAADQYEVHARCIYKSGDTDGYATRLFWTSLAHVITDDFIRPGKVLVALKALASNELQGALPDITWLQTRDNIWAWDPDVTAYVQKPAYNPAWACYDLIHRCRKIYNINTSAYEYIVKGYPAARLTRYYQEFVDWAAFCVATDLRFDYYYDVETNLWDALKLPEECGRGKAMMRGTHWGAMWDGVATPVQLFTAGNIGASGFREEYLGMNERATSVEVDFRDEELDFDHNIFPVMLANYDNDAMPSKPVRIELPGCKRFDQAYRQGAYRLRLNQLVRVCSWPADIEAIACRVGDVVNVAHYVLYGDQVKSGRLADADANTVTLDQIVTMLPATAYTAIIRTQDDTQLEKAILNQAAAFTRASTAYDRIDGHSHAANVARYETGPWAGYLAALAEEGTVSLANTQTFLNTDDNSDGIANGYIAWATGAATGTRSMDAGIKTFGRSASQKIVRTGGAAADAWGIRSSALVTGVVQPSINSFLINVTALDAGAKVRLHTEYYDAAGAWLESKLLEITAPTSGFVKYSSVYTTNPLAVKVRAYVWIYNGNGTAYIQAIQPENKAYATTWHNGTRAVEPITVPLAGMSPAAGTWEQWVYINAMAKRQDGSFNRIFQIPGADADAAIRLMHAAASADWYLRSSNDAGTQSNIIVSDSYTPNGWHFFKATWSAAVMHLYIDNILRGTANTPNLPSGFAANAFVGSYNGADQVLNTLHACVRLSPIDRSGETADLTVPLPVDNDTVGLWLLNGTMDVQTRVIRVTVPFEADTETAVYVDGTHFTVSGNRTADYPPGATIILEGADSIPVIMVVVDSVYNAGPDTTTVEIASVSVPTDLTTSRYQFTTPRRHDPFSLGVTGTVVKPFRVLNIARSGDLQYRLTGLEYDADVYVEATPPVITITEPSGTVTNLRATESLDPLGTRWVNVAWTPPRKDYYGARVLAEGVQMGQVGFDKAGFSFALESSETITIMVVAVNKAGKDFGYASIEFIPGDITPPAVPTGLTIVAIAGGLSERHAANTEADFIAYEVHVSVNTGFTPTDDPPNGPAAWNGTTNTLKTYGDQLVNEILNLTPGTIYYVKLKSVDTKGNQSAATAQASGTPLQTSPDLTAPASLAGIGLSAGSDVLYQDGQGNWFVRITLSLTTIPVDALRAYIQIKARQHASTQYWLEDQLTTISGDTTATIDGLLPGVAYDFVAVPMSSFGIAGTGKTQSDYTVAGDTTAPAAPAGTSLTGIFQGVKMTGTPNSESDLMEYELFVSLTEAFNPTGWNGAAWTGAPNVPADWDGGANNLIAVGRTLPIAGTGLVPETIYYAQLVARDWSGNRSTPSAELSAIASALPGGDIAISSVPGKVLTLPLRAILRGLGGDCILPDNGGAGAYGLQITGATNREYFLEPVLDASIKEYYPNVAFPGNEVANAVNDDYALLKWDLAGVVGTVDTTWLRLFCYGLNSGGVTINIDKITAAWTAAVTWNTKPAATEIYEETGPLNSNIYWTTEDAALKILVDGWKEGTITNHGLQLRIHPNTAWNDFRNRLDEDPAKRPALYIKTTGATGDRYVRITAGFFMLDDLPYQVVTPPDPVLCDPSVTQYVMLVYDGVSGTVSVVLQAGATPPDSAICLGRVTTDADVITVINMTRVIGRKEGALAISGLGNDVVITTWQTLIAIGSGGSSVEIANPLGVGDIDYRLQVTVDDGVTLENSSVLWYGTSYCYGVGLRINASTITFYPAATYVHARIQANGTPQGYTTGKVRVILYKLTP